jgi:hypothetical protein
MKPVRYLEEEKIMEKGVKLLMRGLGPVDTRRFIEFARPKREESVTRHRQWQKKLKKDKFLAQVFA